MVRQTARKCKVRQALTLDDAAANNGEGQLEHVFCKIDCDGCSMHDGGLLRRESISSSKQKPRRSAD
jgi:hypothetical protein